MHRLRVQAALYNLGLTGIPVTNVNNNCSTGSTALLHAANLIRGGLARCTLALGFERMAPGSLGSHWPDRENPMQALNAADARAEARLGKNHGPGAPRMFSNGAQEYFELYGGDITHLAKIGEWEGSGVMMGRALIESWAARSVEES